jgi:hypothetical protein
MRLNPLDIDELGLSVVYPEGFKINQPEGYVLK